MLKRTLGREYSTFFPCRPAYAAVSNTVGTSCILVLDILFAAILIYLIFKNIFEICVKSFIYQVSSYHFARYWWIEHLFFLCHSYNNDFPNRLFTTSSVLDHLNIKNWSTTRVLILFPLRSTKSTIFINFPHHKVSHIFVFFVLAARLISQSRIITFLIC